MELSDDTFIPPGLSDAYVATRACPRCHRRSLRAVTSLDQARWLCVACGNCWHLVHGGLRLVDPVGCHGCAARAKRDCIAVFQSEFPRFGAGRATDDDL
jgi:hypothetical protein